MASLLLPSVTFPQAPCSWKSYVGGKRLAFSSDYSFTNDSTSKVGLFQVRAFFPNSAQEPILREALKEPVAFVGGIFAGLLRLDLNEEPLKEWVGRTVEASGISSPTATKKGVEEEEDDQTPQQIEIE
ncbi:hypothetical protein ACP275_09G000900 [Erythranthe tilingii]